MTIVEAEAELAWMLMASLGAVSVVIDTFMLVSSRTARAVALVQLWSTSSLALCAIAVVDLTLGLRGTLSGLGLLLCRGVVFSAAIVLAIVILKRPLRSVVVGKGGGLRTGVTPTLIALAATGWASNPAVEPTGGEPSDYQFNLIEVFGAELRTDRGYPVPVYRLRSVGVPDQRSRARRSLNESSVSQKA